MKTISQTLREAIQARIRQGETYYSIGRACGISQQIISRFVSEERKNIRSDTIDALAKYLRIEASLRISNR
jgi:transcriptional regulator with XRE-family HTH domain